MSAAKAPPAGAGYHPLLRQLGLQIPAFLCAIFFVGPFLWTVLSSFKTVQEIGAQPPTWLPEVWQWQNYLLVWTTQPFGLWTLNSVLVSVVSTIGLTFASAVTAYAFARFRFPLRNVFFIILLSTLILPREVTLVPLFLLFRDLKWLNTLLPLTVPNLLAVGGNGAFLVFLLRQAIMTIPRDYDEAAKVDGANSAWIFFHIILPLISSALVTAAVFAFLFNWNEFLYPLIFLSDKESYTLPVGLRFFQTFGAESKVSYEHLLMAASTLASLPPVLLFFIGQRYLVQGAVMSGLKS